MTTGSVSSTSPAKNHRAPLRPLNTGESSAKRVAETNLQDLGKYPRVAIPLSGRALPSSRQTDVQPVAVEESQEIHDTLEGTLKLVKRLKEGPNLKVDSAIGGGLLEEQLRSNKDIRIIKALLTGPLGITLQHLTQATQNCSRKIGLLIIEAWMRQELIKIVAEQARALGCEPLTFIPLASVNEMAFEKAYFLALEKWDRNGQIIWVYLMPDTTSLLSRPTEEQRYHLSLSRAKALIGEIFLYTDTEVLNWFKKFWAACNNYTHLHALMVPCIKVIAEAQAMSANLMTKS